MEDQHNWLLCCNDHLEAYLLFSTSHYRENHNNQMGNHIQKFSYFYVHKNQEIIVNSHKRGTTAFTKERYYHTKLQKENDSNYSIQH